MFPLKISQISKSFSKIVLDDINFEVNNNEIFGFIGLNGQGKTTLIKIILDLLDQDNGEVEIKHIDNMSDDLSERIKKYKPIVVELDKLDKRMSKSLRRENKLFIIDSQFASFLGQELGELLTGTKAREARRNVDSFDEINEVLAFLYDVSCIDWERLSIDLQNNHSAKQPIKWTQIKE